MYEIDKIEINGGEVWIDTKCGEEHSYNTEELKELLENTYEYNLGKFKLD